MRYHFFLHYGWFFQNLGKEAVRTFMHTTVAILIHNTVQLSYCWHHSCLLQNLLFQLSKWTNSIVQPLEPTNSQAIDTGFVCLCHNFTFRTCKLTILACQHVLLCPYTCLSNSELFTTCFHTRVKSIMKVQLNSYISTNYITPGEFLKGNCGVRIEQAQK